MNIYIVTLLSVLSAVHWIHGQDLGEQEKIVVRHVQPLGDWFIVNPNQGDIQEATRKAVEKFNTKSKAKKYFRLVEVTSAQTKVTDVINYKISAIIGRTKCLKTEPGDLDLCNLTKKMLRCKFDVEYNPRNEKYMEKHSCNK